MNYVFDHPAYEGSSLLFDFNKMDFDDGSGAIYSQETYFDEGDAPLMDGNEWVYKTRTMKSVLLSFEPFVSRKLDKKTKLQLHIEKGETIMSGGYFNYEQNGIEDIVRSIEVLIRDNNQPDEYGDFCGYSDETLAKFKEALIVLKKAYIMAQRLV